jgi:hypothetical protein
MDKGSYKINTTKKLTLTNPLLRKELAQQEEEI